MNKIATFCCMLLITAITSFFLPFAVHAQIPITPSYYPLTTCQNCSSPSYPVLSGGASPSISTPGTNSEVSPAPCDNSSSGISDNARHSKHKKHNGAISNFMQQILEFFLKLINLLLQLLGGGQISSPSTTTNVTASPVEQQPVTTTNPGSEQPQVTAATPCSGQQIPSETNPETGVPSNGGPSTSPSGGAQSAIDLSKWKLQLPTGSQGKVDEIQQPQLATYTKSPYYVPSGGSITFRAPVNGVTTSGSNYPRSELREMNGSAEAAWSSSTGTHTMTINEAITAVPKTKKHIVAGQIHDASSDVIVIRLEMPKLFVDINGTAGPVLDANYTLGKKFTVKFEVTGGKTNIYYNGGSSPAYSMTKSYSGAYFKAGAYTQANCTTEASSDCNESDYGEVAISGLTVTSQ